MYAKLWHLWGNGPGYWHLFTNVDWLLLPQPSLPNSAITFFCYYFPWNVKNSCQTIFFFQKSQLKSSPDYPIPKHIPLFRMGIIYSKTAGLPSTDTAGFSPSWTTAVIVSGVATPAQHSVYFYQIFAESPSKSVPWLSFSLSGMGKQRNGVFEGGWWLTGRDLCTLPIVGSMSSLTVWGRMWASEERDTCQCQ